MKKMNIDKARPLIKMAIKEDLGKGDVTSELLFPEDTIDKANIISIGYYFLLWSPNRRYLRRGCRPAQCERLTFEI